MSAVSLAFNRFGLGARNDEAAPLSWRSVSGRTVHWQPANRPPRAQQRTSTRAASAHDLDGVAVLHREAAAHLLAVEGRVGRGRDQVEQLRGHVAGVIVGSALVEVLESGQDAAAFLRALRPS